MHSAQGLSTVFCVQEQFNWPHASVYRVHYRIIRGRGHRGFWLCDVASLVMCCNEAPQRIVKTKSLYRTAPSFSMLNGRTCEHRSTQGRRTCIPACADWRWYTGRTSVAFPHSYHPPSRTKQYVYGNVISCIGNNIKVWKQTKTTHFDKNFWNFFNFCDLITN